MYFWRKKNAAKINGGIHSIGINSNDVAKTFNVYKTDVEELKVIELIMVYNIAGYRIEYYFI